MLISLPFECSLAFSSRQKKSKKRRDDFDRTEPFFFLYGIVGFGPYPFCYYKMYTGYGYSVFGGRRNVVVVQQPQVQPTVQQERNKPNQPQ